MILSLIAAVDKNLGIGKDNQLLWHLPADLKYFKKITSGNTVIMGRLTYESIGKALPNRRNIVLSRNKDFVAEGCEVMEDLFSAIKSCKKNEEVFILGGADAFFPEFSLSGWKLVHMEMHKADEKNKYNYTFSIYQRIG